MRPILVSFLMVLGLVSCQNPLPSTVSDTTAGSRSLTLQWTLPLTPRSLAPTTYPTPTTYEVLLHPVVGADRYQDGLTGQSWTFQNLTAAVYTVSLKGKNDQGGVLVQGSANVDLTWAASASPTIDLQYLTAGTGTGQIHLTLGLDGAPGPVTSVTVTMTDPSGTVSQPALTGGNTLYTNTNASVGSYRLFVVAKTANKTALKMESLLVAQNVDTVVTLPFASGDFNATYVPVTSLTLNKTSGTVGLTTDTLTPTFNAGASNTLLTWTSSNPSVIAVDASGGVTGLTLGSATITATSVDHPSVTASCAYTVRGMVGYDANTATSGSVPVDTGPYTMNDTVTVKGNTGSLAKTGYTFVGWNTLANGSGTAYSPESTLTMGTTLPTLYAQWAPVWTVTYSGGTSTSGTVPTDNNTYQQNATVTVKANSGTLAVDGLTFIGWNTLANGTGTAYQPGSTFAMGTASVTLYAQFAATHTITYLADDATSGTAPSDPTPYSVGATATVAANPGLLLKTGFLFAGWNTQADRLGTSWAPGADLTMASTNVTLYPVWIPSNLTFYASGNGIMVTGYLVAKPTGALVIPAGVTLLDSYGFQNCTGLTTLSILGKLDYVGYGAFQNCTGLTSVSAPYGISAVLDNAFAGCRELITVSISSRLSMISTAAFTGCTKLETMTFPPDLAYLGVAAFAQSGLTSVTIPGTVPQIGNSAFLECASLTSVTIGTGVTYIGAMAFAKCVNLVAITIPSTVASIAGYTFQDCVTLTSMTLLGTTPPAMSPGSHLVQGTAITAIHVPVGSLAAYQAAPGWSEYIGLLVSP